MDTRRIFRSAATWATLLAGVSSSVGAQHAEETLEAEDAPRAAASCLRHPTIRRTRVLNDRNIVFITRDHAIYNNHLPSECPSLRRGSMVHYPIENGRLCAGGNFQVLWERLPGNYIPTFACKLGYFVPITEGELEELITVTEENRERRPRRRSTREAVTTEQIELPPADTAPRTSVPAAAE